MEGEGVRVVGEYEVGRRIGSGSFAVVWKGRHRETSQEVAVKEIDKKLLSPKVSENLLKEISILSTIDHPNIIRLFESIQTKDRIFLVLEYCGGGDLGGYISRHGRVSEDVARHFMRQLAAGLQVLQEKHLIHRDLKPQNLLLSSNEAFPQLKIGDFGFARSLTPQDLADTLCGSPLYMAPEIIQNQKYDAKADLWSVGAILFQLVTGKPPFDGNNQYQLFQNVLTSTELCFPRRTLEELHPDCIELCRRLLRHNRVERLTFSEFFNHKFLGESRPKVDSEQSSVLVEAKQPVEHFDASASSKRSQMHIEHPMLSAIRNPRLASLSTLDYMEVQVKEHGLMPQNAADVKESADISQCLSRQLRGAGLMDSIEKDYVFVNRHFGSMENFSCLLESSLQDSSTSRITEHLPKKTGKDAPVAMQTKEFAFGPLGRAGRPTLHGSDPVAASLVSTIVREVQELSVLRPSTRLHLLRQYVQAISEVAQELHDKGSLLESFSVELVILAIWKKALHICGSWMAKGAGSESPESSKANESSIVRGGIHMADPTNLSSPSSAGKWAEQGFLAAFDRAEKLSFHLQDMDASVEMPDAMELIFQKALAVGTNGAVDEYMENKGNAALSYSKAMLLLSFIVGEAISLPLMPPFSLTPADKKRIQNYIIQLQSHQSRFLQIQQFPEVS